LCFRPSIKPLDGFADVFAPDGGDSLQVFLAGLAGAASVQFFQQPYVTGHNGKQRKAFASGLAESFAPFQRGQCVA
jgi:hypothetical protein